MHSLLCFYLFSLSELDLQIQFPLIIHPAHCSLQPCSLLSSLAQEDTCAHTGWQFPGLGARGPSWPGPLHSPARSRAAGAALCERSKPQQSTKPHVASFGSRRARGSDDLLVLHSQALVGDNVNSSMLELPRGAPGGLAQQHLENAKGRRSFPRCLAAKCLRLCWRLAAGVFLQWFVTS